MILLFVALLTGTALVGLAAHFYTAGRPSTLGVVAFSPYFMLAAPVAVLIALLARQWVAAVVTIVVLALCVSTQSRLYLASTPPKDAHALVVMTSNLLIGSADPAAVLGAIRRHHVDVLMLEELTDEEQTRLIHAGLNKVLPHHVSEPMVDAAGTGLWSRYPLSDIQRPADFSLAFVTARVTIPGVRTRPTLVALHMAGPVPDSLNWLHDIARLPAVLDALPADAPVIVGGDFNSTPDTKQFRAVVTHGYADAADQAGAGSTRTYPSDKWYPPLIAIDHVLTRDAVATSAKTIEIPGSDHRALVVTVAVPRTG